MGRSLKTFALMKGGRIYTLNPYYREKYENTRWKYIGYCDGQRCGAFVSKKEFEAFVDREPDLPPMSQSFQVVSRACMWSEFDGSSILQKIIATAAPGIKAEREQYALAEGSER